MNGMDFENLRTARTARTYPVEAARLARAVAEAARGLEGWELSRSSEGEVRAVCRTRLGSWEDIVVRLAPLESGAHTNTHATFESASRAESWNLGRNKRNLAELLRAIDENLKPKKVRSPRRSRRAGRLRESAPSPAEPRRLCGRGGREPRGRRLGTRRRRS